MRHSDPACRELDRAGQLYAYWRMIVRKMRTVAYRGSWQHPLQSDAARSVASVRLVRKIDACDPGHALRGGLTREFYLRELARVAGLPPVRCSAILGAGRRRHCAARLARASSLFPRQPCLSRIRRAARVGGKDLRHCGGVDAGAAALSQGIDVAFVYGSVARGENVPRATSTVCGGEVSFGGSDRGAGADAAQTGGKSTRRCSRRRGWPAGRVKASTS